MNKFERARIEIKEEDLTTNFGRFLIEPLERGFATTLGNAIRRVMISSLPGAAVYSVKIDNVFHEFTTVKGVKEDVTMIILNLKSLILKINDDEPHALRIDAFGPKVVTAADIELPAGVECLNPELVICTLEEDSEIHMEMMAKIGRGYVSNEENKRIYQATSQGIGTIYTDSIYTPVVKANFQAEPTRVGESTKYDRLILEVTTDGTISPRESIALASKILMDHLEILTHIDEAVAEGESLIKDKIAEKANNKTNMIIEELDLSVRSYNCLKRHGISTVEELIEMTEDDLMKVRNLGKKSLKEVKDKVHALNLEFRRVNKE
ncbi:MAG: DNA-directed RNA polymerase subunit alpha [Erysipelotrichaceae bacterium]|jgi:DNA-directed RNA polymerase subunit alpha|nr:DNA-directed RNA polymerase subunit alpha [Erysipelotrichaceae bacterium]